MLNQVRTKIRALIEDFTKSDFEVFTYTNSSIFILSESNIVSIVEVSKNSSVLGSGDYSYDSTTNKLTIIGSLIQGDIITVNYTYTKYSDTELTEYVRAAIVWISIFGYEETDYEIENDDFYPTPDNKTLDLFALISSIIIKPNYTIYRLPNLTVKYPRNKSKEEKIEKLIVRFNRGLGISEVIEFY
ncbi:unnamed protein product [marine sediment metagenome]|uniref:Uncharacterized protein n=1 Tax=marine sediment metagenome TaxID=412755 RepID=X1BRZ7_9ZZZZ